MDVDFGLIPKIRMAFANKKSDRKELAERDVEGP
jgi:folate-dependent tRNA-U54 methylase TrmFO/GidA